MESGKYRTPLGMPALHESQEFGRSSGIDSGEWLVEHNQARILGNQPGEQHALHLPAGKRTDGAALKARQSDCCDCRFDDVIILAGNAAEHAAAAPQSHRHHVVNIDWKRMVDFGYLRQIGDAAAIDAVALD